MCYEWISEMRKEGSRFIRGSLESGNLISSRYKIKSSLDACLQLVHCYSFIFLEMEEQVLLRGSLFVT